MLLQNIISLLVYFGYNTCCIPVGGGHKGGPKTAKPHRNTPKNRQPHQIFSRIPKPHVHGGPLYESGHQQDLWHILVTLCVNIKRTIITLTVYCPKLLYCTVLFLLTKCKVCGSCTWTSVVTSPDFEKTVSDPVRLALGDRLPWATLC